MLTKVKRYFEKRVKEALRSEAGFTLIELIMVVVILGVLAAVAIPRYVDLSANAEVSALNGVATSMTAASSMNYAVYTATNGGQGAAVTACSGIVTLLDGGVAPTGYTVAGPNLTSGVESTCTVTQDSTGNTANYYMTGT